MHQTPNGIGLNAVLSELQVANLGGFKAVFAAVLVLAVGLGGVDACRVLGLAWEFSF